MRISIFSLLGLIVSLAGTASAAPSKLARHVDFEKRMIAELRPQDGEAAAWFERAIALTDSGEYAAAAELCEHVRQRVPGFHHATRRLAMLKLWLGQRAEAIALAREAVGANRLVDNLTLLALALAHPVGDHPASPADLEEAAATLRHASEADPDDIDVYYAMCHVALERQDGGALLYATPRLASLAPDEFPTHYYSAFAQAIQGKRDAAKKALERARALGLPDDAYQGLLLALDRQKPSPMERAGVGGAWTLGLWLGTLLLLLGSGLVLSRITLRRAAALPAMPEGRVRGLDALLRGLYRAVLWASCAYYYVSIPMLVVLVLAAAGGVIYGFFALGRIPIKLVAFVAILALATLYAIMRSILVRAADADPGMRLDLSCHPKLPALLIAVAERIGTRPVDQVYLTPGTDMAVMERGGMLRQLRGTTERCLILGAGVLDAMSVGPFKAVLGHEYGHFSNRDTAGGGFALAVRRSLGTMAYRLVEGGAAAWYNPAWLFLAGFERVFLRISQGASRLQEVLADRWAAFGFGSEAFERGLRHVIEKSVRFEVHIQATLKEAVEGQRPLANLYAYRPAHPAPEEDLRKAIEQAMDAKPSPYDSHPAPADRIAWVRALAAPAPESSAGDEEEVWSLFEGREGLERLMTDEVRGNVMAQCGVKIAAGEWAPAAKV